MVFCGNDGGLYAPWNLDDLAARKVLETEGMDRYRSPLIAEGGGLQAYPWLRRILVVDVPEAVQLQRLLARDGIDETLARTMIQAQASRRERLAIADDVLVNDGGIDAIAPQVAALDRLYRRLAASAAP